MYNFGQLSVRSDQYKIKVNSFVSIPKSGWEIHDKIMTPTPHCA